MLLQAMREILTRVERRMPSSENLKQWTYLFSLELTSLLSSSPLGHDLLSLLVFGKRLSGDVYHHLLDFLHFY